MGSAVREDKDRKTRVSPEKARAFVQLFWTEPMAVPQVDLVVSTVASPLSDRVRGMQRVKADF
ncbi:MAG: hypothetical protein ACE5HL_05375 [Terriglobia bacterium]